MIFLLQKKLKIDSSEIYLVKVSEVVRWGVSSIIEQICFKKSISSNKNIEFVIEIDFELKFNA